VTPQLCYSSLPSRLYLQQSVAWLDHLFELSTVMEVVLPVVTKSGFPAWLDCGAWLTDLLAN